MTHITCRLTAKNRVISSGTLRSVIEYGLPFFYFTSTLQRDLSATHSPLMQRTDMMAVGRAYVISSSAESAAGCSDRSSSAMRPPHRENIATIIVDLHRSARAPSIAVRSAADAVSRASPRARA